MLVHDCELVTEGAEPLLLLLDELWSLLLDERWWLVLDPLSSLLVEVLCPLLEEAALLVVAALLAPDDVPALVVAGVAVEAAAPWPARATVPHAAANNPAVAEAMRLRIRRRRAVSSVMASKTPRPRSVFREGRLRIS